MKNPNQPEPIQPEGEQNILGQTVTSLRLGSLQAHRNLAIFPIFGGNKKDPNYILMPEAIKGGALTIGEVNESGSVPTLKVTNEGAESVLIVDGEELEGAKQNRVLNASVYIPASSSMEIPVSCSEKNRWSYKSRKFSSSEIIMSRKARKTKLSSVSKSLEDKKGYQSCQHSVWSEIDDLHRSMSTRSSTSAMKDAFLGKKEELDALAGAFPVQEGQTGVLVYLDGRISSFELVSDPKAYASLHHKVILSHATSAIVSGKETAPHPKDADVGAFLKDLGQAQYTTQPSSGEGLDYRFQFNGFEGASLQVKDALVHTVVFGE